MGFILQDVSQNHLSKNPHEKDILKAFLHCFNITWGAKIKKFNTELSFYIVNPEPFMKETFGFSSELLLVYSPYDTMESRTIQASEAFMQEFPAKGRVETLSYILISECPDVQNWVNTYISDNGESRIIMTFYAQDLRDNMSKSYFVRKTISDQFYSRDLFDYSLPLNADTYFFGRSRIIAEYIDSIKRGENKGIFGLRKTGKTSLIYKLSRIVKTESIGNVFIYDCKNPSIRKLRWNDLLKKILLDICQHYSISCKDLMFDEINISDSFMLVLKQVDKSQKIVLAFDEIEYISFIAKQDPHWNNDFIDFWQTIWACQSLIRNFVVIIAGVSPIVVEKDTINDIQNPLFGIVRYHMLTGFELEEMKTMVKKLGRRMGLQFNFDALEYIHKEYGGHPLLTRLAISHENKLLSTNKPFTFTIECLKQHSDGRNNDLAFYFRHVVSEISQFYPEEYEMLEILACGQIRDFIELSVYSDYIKHLESYGLIKIDQQGIPKLLMPVVGKYVALNLAHKEGRRAILKIVPIGERIRWLSKRIDMIISDFKKLEYIISTNDSLPTLFGINSFPNSNELKEIEVANTKSDFKNMIDILNRCFVESIERYGSSIGNNNYLWTDVSVYYSDLLHSLRRVKLYRHHSFHLELKPEVQKKLDNFFAMDLENRNPSDVHDLHFVLQQCTLDSLLNSLQIEICKYS